MNTWSDPDFDDSPPPGEDWGAQLFQAGHGAPAPGAPRCPWVLLLDASRSMAGAPIAALNEGLRGFAEELAKDELARQRVELAVVTFGGTVQVVQDFAPADSVSLPELRAGGPAPLGSGVLKALDLIAARKAELHARGVAYYRPWLFLVSDGPPRGEALDVTRQAVQRLRAEEAADRVFFFAVGGAGANLKWLAKLSARPPLKLRGPGFGELFTWLARSAGLLARSRAGEQVALPPVEWGSVAP
jgi:uncharacterized protein YegL